MHKLYVYKRLKSDFSMFKHFAIIIEVFFDQLLFDVNVVDNESHDISSLFTLFQTFLVIRCSLSTPSYLF